MRRWLACLLLAGCSETPEAEKNSEPISMAEYCSQQADAWCAKMSSADCGRSFDATDCAEAYATACCEANDCDAAFSVPAVDAEACTAAITTACFEMGQPDECAGEDFPVPLPDGTVGHGCREYASHLCGKALDCGAGSGDCFSLVYDACCWDSLCWEAAAYPQDTIDSCVDELAAASCDDDMPIACESILANEVIEPPPPPPPPLTLEGGCEGYAAAWCARSDECGNPWGFASSDDCLAVWADDCCAYAGCPGEASYSDDDLATCETDFGSFDCTQLDAGFHPTSCDVVYGW